MTPCRCFNCPTCKKRINMRAWRANPHNRAAELAKERERKRQRRLAELETARAAERAYYAANRDRIQRRRKSLMTDEDRAKAAERMRIKRQDPAYREAERARDRARKRRQQGDS